MTVTHSTQATKHRKGSKNDGSASPVPRKRRKRAAGSGAADDCFTCAGLKAKCDRRRPYCSPCLDSGRQCSGYKTTLTWGVGVASRGKLRGLSLPVSGATKVAQSTHTIAPVSLIGAQRDTGVQKLNDIRRTSAAHMNLLPTTPGSPLTPTTDEINPPQLWISTATISTIPRSLPLSAEDHNSFVPPPSSMPQLPNTSSPCLPPTSYPLHYSQTSPAFTSHDIPKSPQPGTYTPNQPYIHSFNSRNGLPKVEPIGLDNVIFPTSTPTYQTYGATYFDGSPIEPTCPPIVYPPLNRKRSRDDDQSNKSEQSQTSRVSYEASQSAVYYHSGHPRQAQELNYPTPFFGQWVSLNPRMRYLIGYYTEVIAPVIVTFDSPQNPFRVYMLELARNSETLQHAIAALSLSNLRQRRKNWATSAARLLPPRQSAQDLRMTDQAFKETFGMPTPDEQQLEESYHKAMTVKSINAQLADPSLRRSDAVLATLLILCMFHMCDTGLASFRSQFAGIKKLLAIRGAGKTPTSNLMNWFTRIFTWFDTMTATINDRDSQLNGSLLDITTTGEDEWSLEILSGVDRRLFKIVAQLGRLNQLSQTKSVDNNVKVEAPIVGAPLPPLLQHYPPFSYPIYRDGSMVPEALPYDLPPSSNQNADPRAGFWKEWHKIRRQLESWRLGVSDSASPNPTNINHTFNPASASLLATQSPALGSTSPSASSSSSVSSSGSSPRCSAIHPPTPTSVYGTSPAPSLPPSLLNVSPANLLDISNISESFRYSALLYLERLAYPNLPSGHPRFQRLVSASLHYISAVQSDVFLLWPLFVTGSECMHDADRTIIRMRCSGIQNDSGFVNNLSCLALLEKIWKNQDAGSASFTSSSGNVVVGGAAFRWRPIIDAEKVTDADEYIVV
ncbi:hypothetical protein FQN57_002506 [Myotisia sp. PD_48]|nr:hypothetical protein FQN57_002506 [Myotisia sp. PD_48]